jgi:deoxyribodipyrimidine photo-lyase
MTTKRVLYWCSRAPRIHDNPALHLAQQIAIEKNCRLQVYFNVYPKYPHANSRNMRFLLEGLIEFSEALAELNIPFIWTQGNLIEHLTHQHAFDPIETIVTEQHVLKPILNAQSLVRQFTQDASINFLKVNTACVVPVDIASPKLEFAARTFRPKIMKQYRSYLNQDLRIQTHPFNHEPCPLFTHKDVDFISQTNLWPVLTPSKFKPGEQAALSILDRFIEHHLPYYHLRNDINADGQSFLSPYLHYGFIGARHMISKVRDSLHPNAELFIEEAMVRRELAENFCYYCPHYDSIEGAWDWAKQTLNAHRSDQRPYTYTLEQFEQGLTHEPLWNECQRRVREDAYLHSYLRMYWAKMVLLWTNSPEEAHRILVHLNDTYFLDGRDPNGYTGILWSIAGVHDRPWFDKPIHGLIRAMGKEGTLKKSKIRF